MFNLTLNANYIFIRFAMFLTLNNIEKFFVIEKYFIEKKQKYIKTSKCVTCLYKYNYFINDFCFFF